MPASIQMLLYAALDLLNAAASFLLAIFVALPGRRARGTGIGLTIAKTWVDAHGGRIWAESDGTGQGSRFVFTLPF